MMFLALTTDKFDMIRSSAAAIDTQANYIDATTATGVMVGGGNEQHAFSSAATADVLAAPAGSTLRTMKQFTARNKDASLSCDLTFRFNQNGTGFEICKFTLAPGDTLQYIEGVGFFLLTNTSASIIDANSNTADVVANAADTYLTGASLNVSALLQAQAVFRWRFVFTKTGAGVATPIFNIRFGTGGSTGDTARNTFTFLAQTGVIDTGWVDIEASFRAVGASGQIQASARMEHKLTTTGIANAAQVQILQALSATFDTTISGSIIGVSCNPGASGVWTFQNVSVTAAGLVKQR